MGRASGMKKDCAPASARTPWALVAGGDLACIRGEIFFFIRAPEGRSDHEGLSQHCETSATHECCVTLWSGHTPYAILCMAMQQTATLSLERGRHMHARGAAEPAAHTAAHCATLPTLLPACCSTCAPTPAPLLLQTTYRRHHALTLALCNADLQA